MMSAVWIGWAAIFMSLVIGDYTGGDPVLSMVVGCSCLAIQCGMGAMALECALSMQSMLPGTRSQTMVCCTERGRDSNDIGAPTSLECRLSHQ